MSAIRIEGVTFAVYTMDHRPAHVHGRYAGIEVIVHLFEDVTVALSRRTDAVRPGNASRSDVSYVLRLAAENFTALRSLWEKHHG